MAGNFYEKLLILYTVIFTFGFNILKVNSLKCHQCNSLIEPKCADLKYTATSTNLIDKFLLDCPASVSEHHNDNNNVNDTESGTVFCRKTTYFINYEKSNRVVRACGWLKDHSRRKMRKQCINADNEGYLQTICMCDTDGCNSAPYQIIGSKLLYLASAVTMLLSFCFI